METMIELERAKALILAQVGENETENLRLENSYGRVLASNLVSPCDLPPFTRSPLDGFAYVAEAGDEAPLKLRVVSEIPAGYWSERSIAKGEAARIFTGAPLPPGVNCVVRSEDTEEESGSGNVIIQKTVKPGANVVKQGEELGKGASLLKTGTYLSAPAIGFLSSVGIQDVEVYRRPRVGVLSTGSELAEVGDPLKPAKIYNSNSYTLRGLAQGLGCDVKVLPIVADSLDETVNALKTFEDRDVIITTGGASVGAYDLMPSVLSELGCHILFWKVNLKPGTPVVMGYKGKQLYFSLSGNPAAAMATFELLIRPALRKYAGRADWQEEPIDVRIAGDFDKGGRQRRFLRGKVRWQNGEIWADIDHAQSSGILRSLIGCQLLIDVPAEHGPVRYGEQLKAYWINGWEG